MHNYRKLYFALLAGTILSTPANYVAAATLTPTLDTIKAEAAAEVEIAGVKYYFTPTGEDAALLKTLAGTVARNLVEDAGGIFEFDGKKYGFDVAAIPASVFEYAEGTESDYNFTILEADAEGNLTTKYYKVVLKPETFATSESIKWSTTEQTAGDASGSVEVKLPNNQTQTFYYAYTKPEGYTDAAGRINNTLATANVTNVVFKGISSSSNGGAIYNAENATIGDITGDFIGNSAGENGGAIYNGYKGTIGNITGDFINNETNGNRIFGGAIYNGYKGTIGDITGNFINNHTYSQSTTAGGAIENLGTINSISGNFINNYAQSYNNSTAAGGAIENKSVIRNITANFIGNHAIATNRILGAIYNDSSAVINSINGDFISNYLYSESYRADGSGIYNRGQIYNITGDFIGNYAHSGTSMAYGGAIYNEENIGDIVADFIGNYTQSESGQAQGGAIFNSGTINNITGDFIGNYAGAEKGNAYGGAIYNQAQITSSLPDNLIYHLTIKYGNEKAEIYTLPQGSELSANMQMVSGTLTVNSEYYFNQYKGKDIRAPLTSMLPQLQEEYALVESMIEQLPAMMDYIRDISVDDLTAEQYVDYLVMTGDMPEEQKEAALDAFNAMTEEQQAAAMVQAKEDITEAKQSVEIYDYVSAISVDNLTAEQYIDFAAMMAGGITEDQKEAALNEFNAMPAEEQAAAMVQAKEAITEIKEQMSGEAELNKIAEEIEQTENALAIIESGTPVTEITATVDTEGGINFYNSSFRDNYVKSENGEAKGGAIYGNGVTITADNYTSIIDGNKANDESNAFYVLNKIGTTSVDGNLQDDLQDMFPGGDINLDLTINMPVIGDLTLKTLNNGVILLNDGIDGESGYGIAFNGDKGVDESGAAGGLSLFNSAGDGRTTQYVKLNNSIANAGSISITNTTLSFGEGPYGRGEITADGDPITKVSLQNAAFDLYNKYQDTVNLAGWNASNSYLHVDVDVENLTADILNINGNVEGTTKLVLYPTAAKDITGESIVFAQSSNDTTGTEDSFTVYRVYRSPYMFKVDMTGEGTTEHEWYLTMTDEENEFAGVEPGEQPDPEVPDVDIPDIDIPDINIPTAPVYGEVVAYGALPAAALEQTRNMVDNIGNQIKNNRYYCEGCSFVDGYWNGEPYHNLWVNPTYYTSNIDSPFAIDADIWGIEAGGDIQRDIHNRLGVFFSYRQGEYDMSGNGDRYYSTVGSEIDIDSYLAGLYYRYDHNNWYAFATLYGGIQEADIKTDDGMKSDTDGMEFGASVEAGYDYALTDSVTLTPELGVFYTQVNYDDAEDNVGKSANYDDARQIELEAGVKLAKTFMTDESFANVYVKPSVVQTIVDGEDVNITGLGDVEALDDATLGRIEIGGRYGFTTNLSAYGWVNYTFGSDYDATTFGLGLNYAF